MNKKISFTLILFVLLALPFTFSYTSNDLSWKGSIVTTLDKTSFAPDENITGSIILMNDEDYPIIGGQVVIQIANGTYSYPSQEAEDNIVYETNINNNWLLPHSAKKINFEINSLSGGEYRLDAYAWVVRSMYVGLSSILLSPVSTPFSVSGTKTNGLVIDRKETVFSNSKGESIGPVGFPASAGSEVSGKVVLKNLGTTPKKDVKVVLQLCDWSVVFCDKPTEKEFLVGDIAAGAVKEVEVALTSPLIPSAYEINIIVSSNNTIESIYKNRLIVEGPTAKIRKIALNGLDNKDYSFTVTYTGSPDHFSNPDFGAFNALTEIYLDEKVVDSKTISLSGIKFADVNAFNVSTTAKSFDKACFTFEQNKIVYDYLCVSFDQLEEIQTEYDKTHPKLVEVSWVYNKEVNSLSVKLLKEKINSRIKIISNETILFESTAVADVQYIQTIQLASKSNVFLVVDDLDAKEQQVFSIKISNEEDKTNFEVTSLDNTSAQALCKGTICKVNQTCSGEASKIGEEICCKAECKETELVPIISSLETIPLIFWVALILLVVAIFSGIKAIQEAKRK